MTGTILVLGANGAFGHNAATAFADTGWVVRRFDRKAGDLEAASRGADIILNGWNPAYPDWAEQVPMLTRQVIAAARSSGATVILPGNVYVFGIKAETMFGDQTPHLAENPLGRIRRDMECAYRQSGVRTIILRCGDFIDTRDSGNWFDMILTKKIAKGVLNYPGKSDQSHAWAFLPDVARAVVSLAEMRHHLAVFEDIAFPGYTLSGNQLGAALEAVTARPVRLERMSYLPLWLAAPFWRMARCLLEMRYLWQKPHFMDARKFDALLPGFQPTPLNDALALAIRDKIDPDKAVMRSGAAVRPDQRIA